MNKPRRRRDSRLRASARFGSSRRLFAEPLEERRMLTVVTSAWESEVTFDQFTGGDAQTLAYGYDQSGIEQPEFLGFEYCLSDCGGSYFDFDVPFFEAALLKPSIGLGLDYGFYATAGTGNLMYDGTFAYEVQDDGSGGIQIATAVNTENGALFTQSPTIRAYADLEARLQAGLVGKHCTNPAGIVTEGINTFTSWFTGEEVLPDLCTPINLGVDINETTNLFSLNRNGNGEIGFMGESIDGFAVELADARDALQQSEIDLYRASRDRAQARTDADFQAANARHQEAIDRRHAASGRESEVRSSKLNAVGSRIGGLYDISVSGADDLLGANFELSRGPQRLGHLGVSLPDLALTDQSPDSTGQLSARTSDGDPKTQIADVAIDFAAIASAAANLPVLGVLSADIGVAAADLTLLSYDLTAGLGVNQAITVAPQSKVRFDFTDPNTGGSLRVDVNVDGVVQHGVDSVTFEQGADVSIEPSGDQRIEIKPSLLSTYVIENNLGLNFDLGGRLRALELNASVLGASVIEAGPLFDYEHGILEGDIGSLFDTQFSVSASPIHFETFVIGGPKLDLAVTASGFDTYLEVGETDTVTITVDNNYSEAANGVMTTFVLPEGLIFEPSASDDRCTLSDPIVRCNSGSLNAGEEDMFVVGLTADDALAGERTIEFDVSGIGRDINPDDNTQILRVDLENPSVFIVRSGFDFRPGVNNDELTLRQAVAAANNKPGLDRIFINHNYGTTDLYFGEIEVTDSVEIFGVNGGVIRSQDSTLKGWVAGDDSGYVTNLPEDNPRTVRQFVDFVNGNDWGLFAVVDEGDGSDIFSLEEFTVSPGFSGGSSSTNATLTASSNSGGSSFTIYAPGGDNGKVMHWYSEGGTRSRLFRFGGTGDNTYRLKNLTLAGGNGIDGNDDPDNNPALDGFGGAILITGSDETLILDRVNIRGNSADQGGAIAVRSGKLQVSNSTISEDHLSGGATIFAQNADVSFDRSLLNGTIEVLSGADRGSTLRFHNTQVDNRTDRRAILLRSSSQTSSIDATFDGTTVGGKASLDGESQLFATGDGSVNVTSLGHNLVRHPEILVPQGTRSTFHAVRDIAANVISAQGTYRDVFSDLTSQEPTLLAPAGVAGASIASLTLNAPSAESELVFDVDDPRFEIVGSELRLKPGFMLNAEATDQLDEESGIYYVNITAIDAAGLRFIQEVKMTALGVPSAPRELVVNGQRHPGLGHRQADQVDLTWAVSEKQNESQYRIYQVDNGAETLLGVLDGFGTMFTVEGLELFTTYTFIVESSTPAGIARAPAVAVTTNPLPTMLQNASAVLVERSTAELNWDDVEYEDGYRILLNSVELATLPEGATSYVAEGLMPGTNNVFSIVPFNEEGDAPPNLGPINGPNPMIVNTPGIEPQPPLEFDIDVIPGNGIRLSWSEVADASHYLVYRAVDEELFERIGEVSQGTSTFDFDELTSNGRDRFLILAYNSFGVASTSIALGGEFFDGNPVDTVTILTDASSVPLSSIGGNKYPHIKAIEIGGVASATLTVDAEALGGLSDLSDSVVVQAGLDDQVEFAGEWNLDGGELIDGTFVRRISKEGNAILLDRPDQWHNPVQRYDVNIDGSVSPIDALLVINALNDFPGLLPDVAEVESFAHHFIDTDANLFVSPLDALLVINELNVMSERGFVPSLDNAARRETATAFVGPFAALGEEGVAIYPVETDQEAKRSHFDNIPAFVLPNTLKTDHEGKSEEKSRTKVRSIDDIFAKWV